MRKAAWTLKILILMSLSVTSCQMEKSRLDIALEMAGDNREGLEKVLDFFKNDQRRLEAARFIIENMPGKYTLDSSSVAGVEPYYRVLINYLERNKDYGVTGLYDTTDSLEKAIGRPFVIADYFSDLTSISSEFLARKIDFAVTNWESSPWQDEVPFEDFLRYILPYRVYESWWDGADEYYKTALADSVAVWSHLGKNAVAENIRSFITKEFRQDGTFFKLHSYMAPARFENIVKAKAGVCHDINATIVTALRAFGIPATINTVPYWGNSNASHFWTEIIGAPVRALYNNSQQDFHTMEDELVNDTFWFKGGVIDDTLGIPSAVKLRKTRTVPKIYRKGYEIKDYSLALHAKEDIPILFKDLTLEDVTSSMVVTTDVEVKVGWKNNPRRKRYAYLCCYDPDKVSWTPVAWAKIKHGKASFKDVGVNIVYIAAFYDRGEVIPFGDPFIPEESGRILLMNTDKSKEESVEIFSKVPLRTSEVYYSMMMRGGRFQLANRQELSDTVTVGEIDHIPYYTEEIILENVPTARYALYRIDDAPTRFVGEIEFWGPDYDGKEVKLQGREIGNPCYTIAPRHAAFDGDRVTYAYFDFENYNDDYIGLDFGTLRKVSRITYCPRNDDNAIIPGEEYELFFWQDGWRSLGRQLGGNDRRLRFDNIPHGALLRIHNHTRGNENRPFTVKEGEQVWW